MTMAGLSNALRTFRANMGAVKAKIRNQKWKRMMTGSFLSQYDDSAIIAPGIRYGKSCTASTLWVPLAHDCRKIKYPCCERIVMPNIRESIPLTIPLTITTVKDRRAVPSRPVYAIIWFYCRFCTFCTLADRGQNPRDPSKC